MKKYFLLITVFFAGCFSNSIKNQNTGFRHSLINGLDYKYVFSKYPLYLIDSSLFNTLDSTIIIDSKCHYYRDSNSCYIFSISDMNNYYQIEVRPGYVDYLDSSGYKGIFYHRSKLFVCSSDSMPKEILHKSKDDSVSIRFFKTRFDSENDSINFFLKSIQYWGFDVPNIQKTIFIKNKPIYYLANTCYN